MLPHAAHAGQVVLELRQLDLELALGAPGVLGEDVEDELRAVDDTGRQRVLERALLRRVELVVDEQHLRVGLLVLRLQLLELALAHVAAGIRMLPLLHEVADRLDARRASELAQLGELVLGVGALGQHREEVPALGLDARGRVGLTRRHEADCATLVVMPDLAARLAARTLELVDIPSESRHEAAISAHVRRLVPALFRSGDRGRRRDPVGDGAAARRAARRARRARRHGSRAGQPARTDRERRRARARGERHEGRCRGGDRARARAGRRAAAAGVRRGAARLRTRGAPAGREPAAGPLRGVQPRARGVAGRAARADRRRAPRRVRRQPVRAGRLPRPERPRREAVAGRQRDRARHRGAAAGRGGGAPRRRSSKGCRSTRWSRSRSSTPGSPTTSCPARRPPT